MQYQQQQLFSEWNILCGRLQMLSGCIQNDFERMIEDEYITRDEIKTSIPRIVSDYNIITEEIEGLKNQIISYLNKVADDE